MYIMRHVMQEPDVARLGSAPVIGDDMRCSALRDHVRPRQSHRLEILLIDATENDQKPLDRSPSKGRHAVESPRWAESAKGVYD